MTHLPDSRIDPSDHLSQEPILKLNNVSVQFDTLQILRDITLSVPQGQTLAIIGESGCGKTVLLKTMIGLLWPTEGYVEFDTRRLDQLEDKALTKQRTRFGFVFQNAALFDSMTVAENIEFPMREHQIVEENQIEDIVLRRLSEVGLPKSVLWKKPAELSGGMRKRVGLARSLVMNPDILLYDEPTTGLDPIMSDVISELIIRTRDSEAVTSIVVTHDMRSAKKIADRIVMLYPLTRLQPNESQIIFDGLPEEIDLSPDPRVTQFVKGEAGERLMEMRRAEKQA